MAFHPEREMRILRIADTMRRREWERGVTGPKLASELGLHPDTIAADAAEAWKRVAAEYMGDESVRAEVGVYLSRSLREAYESGDYKAVAQIAKVYADASGAAAPRKLDVSGGVALDDLDAIRRNIAANADACPPEPETSPKSAPDS